MRIYIGVYFLVGLQLTGLSQNNQPTGLTEPVRFDSLKQALAQATNDSSRLQALESIGFYYEVINIDSALKYTEAGLRLARERGNIRAQARFTASLGSIMGQQGKLADALDLLFKSLKIAETGNIPSEIARANRRLAGIYFDLKNFPKAVNYLLAALKIDKTNPRRSSAAIDHMTLGNVYEKMNKLDSAAFHVDKAFQEKTLSNYFTQYLYQVLGNIQLKKGKYEAADSLLQKGLIYSKNNNDFLTASDICASISTLFIKLHKKDSAIFYAAKGFDYGQQVSYKKGIMLSGSLLAELYDSTQPVTAFHYYKIAAAAKDSLFGVNNIQTIQNLIAREEARQKELEDAQLSYRNKLKLYGLLAGIGALLIIVFMLYRNDRQKQKANSLLQQQKEKVESTLTELKSTQAQLIQSEKMASLGELTAGIAHEIQNPLNFVNNFSEVSRELLGEMNEELDRGDIDEAKAIASDIKQNLEKINHHGKRADAIVKGMLLHSQSSSGRKEPTDINALCDEYLRLSYNGVRAKDKSFTTTLKTDFDKTIGKLTIVPQDIGRVIVNLLSNAFYAVQHKQLSESGYEPVVRVSTKKTDNKIFIRVEDNGNGIPETMRAKIFQPFFTTKPTGQGTGLGLSLSYDIVTKGHGGTLQVESNEGEGTVFTIILPA